MSSSAIQIEYRGRLAIITINNDKKLNALSMEQYYDLSQAMREVAKRDDVYITLLIGKGRYFSAYVLSLSSSVLLASVVFLIFSLLSASSQIISSEA